MTISDGGVTIDSIVIQ